MSIPFYSDIDLKNNKIINVGAPESDLDIANKQYVDTSILNLSTTINESILLTRTELTEYIDTQITNINTNMNTTVTQILIDNLVDNVTSTDNTKALSANMGHYLSSLIDDINIKLTELDESDNIYTTTPTVIGLYSIDTSTIPVYRTILTYTIPPQVSQSIEIDLTQLSPDTTLNILNIVGNYQIRDENTPAEGNTLAYNYYFMQYGINENATIGIYITSYNNVTKKLNIFIGSDTLNQLENEQITFIIEYYRNEFVM